MAIFSRLRLKAVEIRQAQFQFLPGQTMTEYALILAAVAVVVYAGYQTMGTDIQSLLNIVDSSL